MGRLWTVDQIWGNRSWVGKTVVRDEWKKQTKDSEGETRVKLEWRVTFLHFFYCWVAPMKKIRKVLKYRVVGVGRVKWIGDLIIWVLIIEENKGELSRSWRVTQRVFGDVKLRDLNAGNVGVDVPLEQITCDFWAWDNCDRWGSGVSQVKQQPTLYPCTHSGLWRGRGAGQIRPQRGSKRKQWRKLWF